MNNRTILAELAGVTKVYETMTKGAAALKNVSFRAAAGEMILILGPSGSGKSTFLTILAGLQSATEGDAYLFDRNIQEYSSKELQELRANRIGFIFQTFHLLDSLSAIDNVLLVMRFARVHGKEAKDRALGYFENFGIQHLRDVSPRAMSQGEKQRVAVARALVNGAELIIADEPTGSLATQQGMAIVRLLHDSVRRENRCVIIASHDERISGYADRVLYLHDGILKTA
jgi:ABC-type lipoprotein export system ATPase subunit